MFFPPVDNSNEASFWNYLIQFIYFFTVTQTVKNLPMIQENWVWSLGWEDPLEKGMATYSNILSWRILWTEEPDGLQSMELQRVRHNWATNTFTYIKDDAVKVLNSACQQIWNTQHLATGLEKVSFHSSSKEGQCQSMFELITQLHSELITQLHSFHMLARWCSKSFKLGFHSRWTENFQKFKLDLEKTEEPEIKSLTSLASEKTREFQKKKNLLLLHWLC